MTFNAKFVATEVTRPVTASANIFFCEYWFPSKSCKTKGDDAWSLLVIVFQMPSALVDEEPRVGEARGVSNYRGNT